MVILGMCDGARETEVQRLVSARRTSDRLRSSVWDECGIEDERLTARVG